MKRICSVILALAAGFALSARAADEEKPQGTKTTEGGDASTGHKGAARRHIWTSDVALEQARLALQGLYALADDDEGAWDKAHAQALLGNAQRSLGMAATHLQHLTSVPSKDKDAQSNLTKAQTSIARVQSALKALEAPIRSGAGPRAMTGSGGDTGMESSHAGEEKAPGAPPETVHGSTLRTDVKNASHALYDAIKDFKKVAGDYGVSTRLPVP
jgi:hypothetical protein